MRSRPITKPPTVCGGCPWRVDDLLTFGVKGRRSCRVFASRYPVRRAVVRQSFAGVDRTLCAFRRSLWTSVDGCAGHTDRQLRGSLGGPGSDPRPRSPRERPERGRRVTRPPARAPDARSAACPFTATHKRNDDQEPPWEKDVDLRVALALGCLPCPLILMRHRSSNDGGACAQDVQYAFLALAASAPATCVLSPLAAITTTCEPSLLTSACVRYPGIAPS
jgi:hypothetical protein